MHLFDPALILTGRGVGPVLADQPLELAHVFGKENNAPADGQTPANLPADRPPFPGTGGKTGPHLGTGGSPFLGQTLASRKIGG
ncbi:MAG: hypothetical protein BWY49_00467 [Candidatus Omnitrophica bacterium ADurb.Bin314]|nr:MAG: hypothetical protein BWY49_00467 [Candidatus Omnitrophica bacterium ADurb.Bin314]